MVGLYNATPRDGGCGGGLCGTVQQRSDGLVWDELLRIVWRRRGSGSGSGGDGVVEKGRCRSLDVRDCGLAMGFQKRVAEKE